MQKFEKENHQYWRLTKVPFCGNKHRAATKLQSIPEHMGTDTHVRALPHKLPVPMCFARFDSERELRPSCAALMCPKRSKEAENRPLYYPFKTIKI